MPEAAATEEPDPITAAQNSPLLAKKPDRPPRDLYDMLGLRQLDPNPDEKWPRDQPIQIEPVLSPVRNDPPPGPGFTLLENDQQERMNWFVWPGDIPTGDVEWPEESNQADQPRHDWQQASGPVDGSHSLPVPEEAAPADPIAPAPVASLRARVWGKIKASLSRFGF
jgi:hypothetical protein